MSLECVRARIKRFGNPVKTGQNRGQYTQFPILIQSVWLKSILFNTLSDQHGLNNWELSVLSPVF